MTCDYTQLANNGVQQLRPYQPGKPVEELQRELGLRDVVKLASNENPLGPSHRALEAARRSLDQIHFYPDGAGFELKHALADNLGVSSDRITLGNGSNDVLELVARAYLQPGDEAVFSEYAFAIYPLVTLGCSAKPVSVDSTPSPNAPGWCFWPTPTTPPAPGSMTRRWTTSWPGCRSG